MLFTCEKCHYIYDNILNRDYCPDCGSKKIHPATASETVKFIEGNSENEKIKKNLIENNRDSTYIRKREKRRTLYEGY